MAVCESQLESGLARINREGDQTSQEPMPVGLPLTVDYRSPVSHFVPPHVDLYTARHHSQHNAESPESTPVKRKRGRPRVDKTSPEYLANVAARKQAREMEILERKAKREYKRRSTADSGASSSTGDTTPRVKRKYTKRAPSAKKTDGSTVERVKGKRGRPRKDQLNVNRSQQPPKIRVRNNLMPINNEPISLDSDDEPDLGSPAASDSLSLDENLRALRHIHEKYANIHKDDMYEAHLLAANFNKPGARNVHDGMSVRSSEGGTSVKDLDTRVEKLEDSSNSDSDSSSSGSGSSSSGSSSGSSSSSDSSSDSDSDSDHGPTNNHNDNIPYPPPFPSTDPTPVPDSDSDPERGSEPLPHSNDEISESDNESPDKSYQCHICRKWYSTRVTLKIHRRSHQNRGGVTSRARTSHRYSCDICSATFPRREKLYAHKTEAHRGSMTFRCEVCRRCFEHDDELTRHAALHTHDDINGRCTECSATFESYEALCTHRAHTHAHSEGSHVCTHCGKRFTHIHSLTRHLHNHAKQLYRCVVCKASFARADQLAQHLNSHLANYKRLKP